MLKGKETNVKGAHQENQKHKLLANDIRVSSLRNLLILKFVTHAEKITDKDTKMANCTKQNK